MYDIDSIVMVVKKLNKMHRRALDVEARGIIDRYSGGNRPFDVAQLDPPVLDVFGSSEALERLFEKNA